MSQDWRLFAHDTSVSSFSPKQQHGRKFLPGRFLLKIDVFFFLVFFMDEYSVSYYSLVTFLQDCFSLTSWIWLPLRPQV